MEIKNILLIFAKENERTSVMDGQVTIKLQADNGSVADFLRQLANEIEAVDSYGDVEDFETAIGCVISVEEE